MHCRGDLIVLNQWYTKSATITEYDDLKSFWSADYFAGEFPTQAQALRQWSLAGSSGDGMPHTNPSFIISRDDANGEILPENNNVCHLTLEAFPRIDNYIQDASKKKRPSISQLYGDKPYNGDILVPHTYPKKVEDGTSIMEGGGNGGHGVVKLGWIEGVLIPCLLNIWGVMLFLRLSWVVGEAGIGHTLIIITISYVVCVITTLSLSAITTNGEVKGGGIYFIISRSLGPEFGASIGIILAFANAVAASMNTIGFCNSLNDLLKSYNTKIIDGGVNDIRLVGVIAILVMVVICTFGMDWEAKAQNVLLVLIVVAIFDFLIGAFLGPQDEISLAQGFVGFNMSVFKENWFPDYHFSEDQNHDFFSVFAIFFPSVTGIQAGANISGDLKDPASAIPKGTLLALLITAISYVSFVLAAGSVALRDASGNVTQLPSDFITQCVHIPGQVNPCQYGLQNSYTIMQLISSVGLIIYIGCFAATLSTALTNLLSVPKLLQALGIDRIYPGFIYLSKEYGKSKEPYRGYVLTFLISSAFVLIAELNVIAPLISNFYLASYALINFCAFHAALVKPLGWRPTFKYYNKWVSLVGCILCVIVMFLLDWRMALASFFIFLMLYFVVVYRKPDVNWGSSTQAQTYKSALTSAHKLMFVGDHVKNYRPQILVLCGQPQVRPPLIDLAHWFTKSYSMLICADVVKEKLSYKRRMNRTANSIKWLQKNKDKAFYVVVDDGNFSDSVSVIMKSTGLGKLRPNVMMLGYKNDWMTCPVSDLDDYYNVVYKAFEYRLSVLILRVPGGLDYSHAVKLPPDVDEKEDPPYPKDKYPIHSTILQASSDYNLDRNSISTIDAVKLREHLGDLTNVQTTVPPTKKDEMTNITAHDHPGMNMMHIFDTKSKKGTIDVWWLYDNGGLTILLPYILSSRSSWSNCKLRIFAPARPGQDLETEEQNMADLLSKFRIKYSSLKMIEDMSKPIYPESKQMFDCLVNQYLTKHPTSCNIDVDSVQAKTNRHLRLRELLLEHSSSATLVIMSLPMPRKDILPAPIYMTWLEILTRDMPPFLLMRGNQTSVLTFYS
uniref:Bumetanide-sensitive sodium-(Potassium)-chloride cotransporter n=1 Tax=Cacopsylla melanoneura TaxID=428564 RepID=A0A8D9ENE6_9HEMI